MTQQIKAPADITVEKRWIPGTHMVEVVLRPPHATNLLYTQTQITHTDKSQ